MSKTAILFGGSGFFGTHLARALAAEPAISRIVIADLSPPRETGPKVTYLRLDVRQPIALDVSGPVEIYNFAAIHRTPGHPDRDYFDTNVRGALEICRFAAAHDTRLMVFASTIGIYGKVEQQADERTAPRPTTAYGRSKLIAEQIHTDWQAADPARKLMIVRPAVTFGPGENGNFTRLARLLRANRFVFPAHKNTIKACAPVCDLAACLRFMAGFDEPVIRFVYAYPERTTVEAITSAFADAAGFKRPTLVVPEPAITLAALGFEALARLGVPTAINRARLRKLIDATNVYPHELMARGWRFPTPLVEALRRWQTESDFT